MIQHWGPVAVPQLAIMGVVYLALGLVTRTFARRWFWIAFVPMIILVAGLIFHVHDIYSYERFRLIPNVGRVNLYGYAAAAAVGLVLGGCAIVTEIVRRRAA